MEPVIMAIMNRLRLITLIGASVVWLWSQ